LTLPSSASTPAPSAHARAFRLVVFDWDGTLMDSIGTIVECTLAAIADVPGMVAPPVETIRGSIGLGLVETMTRFFPDGDPAIFTQVATAYRDRWRAEFKDCVQLLPGAREAVTTLADAGYLLGVATAKGRLGLDRELDATGLRPYFHATRTVDEAPSKPAPGMLLQLCDELAVAPREAVMVGDTAWDLEMARNAGCPGVGVLTGGHGRPQLERLDPLACLASVGELPDWLKDGRTKRERQGGLQVQR
jgi:phosphoglycolate phosphatase